MTEFNISVPPEAYGATAMLLVAGFPDSYKDAKTRCLVKAHLDGAEPQWGPIRKDGLWDHCAFVDDGTFTLLYVMEAPT
ncbi:hypothetical protein ACSMXM_05345 [Pacificimonas sp. ICDLI1SI03]